MAAGDVSETSPGRQRFRNRTPFRGAPQWASLIWERQRWLDRAEARKAAGHSHGDGSIRRSFGRCVSGLAGEFMRGRFWDLPFGSRLSLLPEGRSGRRLNWGHEFARPGIGPRMTHPRAIVFFGDVRDRQAPGWSTWPSQTGGRAGGSQRPAWPMTCHGTSATSRGSHTPGGGRGRALGPVRRSSGEDQPWPQC